MTKNRAANQKPTVQWDQSSPLPTAQPPSAGHKAPPPHLIADHHLLPSTVLSGINLHSCKGPQADAWQRGAVVRAPSRPRPQAGRRPGPAPPCAPRPPRAARARRNHRASSPPAALARLARSRPGRLGSRLRPRRRLASVPAPPPLPFPPATFASPGYPPTLDPAARDATPAPAGALGAPSAAPRPVGRRPPPPAVGRTRYGAQRSALPRRVRESSCRAIARREEQRAPRRAEHMERRARTTRQGQNRAAAHRRSFLKCTLVIYVRLEQTPPLAKNKSKWKSFNNNNVQRGDGAGSTPLALLVGSGRGRWYRPSRSTRD
ncbi:unnamed protein product [Gadus morhua 'NCC']